MNGLYRAGAAPKGATPFVKEADGGVRFDNRSGRQVDFGHAFDVQRGYRVFFCFADTPAFKNTWGGESLLSWATGIDPQNDADRQLQRECRRLARQVIALNAEWERQGRPRGGIVVGEAGHA